MLIMRVALLNMSDALNKGDLAILESTIGLLRKQYPGCAISLFNVDYPDGEVDDPRRFHHLKSLRLESHYGSFFPAIFPGRASFRFLLASGRHLLACLSLLAGAAILKSRLTLFVRGLTRKKIETLLEADLIILKGGSYILSHGGFRHTIFLFRMVFSAFLALSLGKQVIALGHSFGPFQNSCARLLAGYIFRRLHKIVVRDRLSYTLLLEYYNISIENVFLLPDLAFWTKTSPRAGKDSVLDEVLRKEGIALDPLPALKIGLTVRRWHFPGLPRPKELYGNYLRAVSETLGELHRLHGARAFLMPHSRSDLPVAREMVRMAGVARPVLLAGDYSTAELRDLYGEMDLFIGTRIHSALFAFSRGTPVIAIAYEKPKAYGIIGETLGREAVLDIESLTSPGLIARAEEMLRAGPQLRRETFRRWEKLKAELEDGIDELFGEDAR